MKYEHNPFFKLGDFERSSLQVKAVNSTSQMRMRNDSVSITQILDSGVWLEVPPKSCAMGHAIALDIPVHNIQVLGVIEELDDSSENQWKVRLKFRQFSQSDWEKLGEIFTSKQDAINDRIKKTRK